MNLLNTAVELFMAHAGGAAAGADKQSIQNALQNLLPTNQAGEINLSGLVDKLNTPELGAQVSSWLGDGPNQAVTPAALSSALGEMNIGQMAAQLGISQDVIAQGLTQLLPKLIDQSSSGGQILESLLGSGKLEDIASRFFS